MTERLWWWGLLALVLIIASMIVHGQSRIVTLAIGRFGGTDQEILECTFSIGQGASLILHPQGEPCVLARELIGRTGTLLFVPD